MKELVFQILFKSGAKEEYVSNIEEAVNVAGFNAVEDATKNALIGEVVVKSITNGKHATLELATIDGFNHVIDIAGIDRISYIFR